MPESQSIVLAQRIVGALIAAGVNDIVYCPGSRSAPLAYALDSAVRGGLVRAHIRLDERSAGFLALGLTRRWASEPTCQDVEDLSPVAIVTTSGGAVAELHASVAEAAHAHRPLIVLSADRPDEMRGVGASQTTIQHGIFGPHAPTVLDLPADSEPDQRVDSRVARAVHRACGRPSGVAGPVHINVAFRDPLTPQSGSATLEPLSLAKVSSPSIYLPRRLGQAWEDVVDSSLRTVIVAGDGDDQSGQAWAAYAKIPIFAEPTSVLACDPNRIAHQQVLLASPLAEQIQQVIVTGRPTLSRPVSALLGRNDIRLIVVDPHDEWVDVQGRASEVVASLAPPRQVSTDDAWLEQWKKAGRRVSQQIRTILDESPMSVLVLADLVWSHDSRPLMVGASNSIRALDLVGVDGHGRSVVSHRGLAGIDGTIASAIGLACVREEPTVALMGDLTFFHDAGALAIPADEVAPDLLIFVADDGGGSIFSTLEHGRPENAPTFERWFATAQPQSLEHLAHAYGVDYVECMTRQDVMRELDSDVHGIRICHVKCARPAQIADVRKLADQIEYHRKRTGKIQ